MGLVIESRKCAPELFAATPEAKGREDQGVGDFLFGIRYKARRSFTYMYSQSRAEKQAAGRKYWEQATWPNELYWTGAQSLS